MRALLIFVLILLGSAGQQPVTTESPSTSDSQSSKVVEKEETPQKELTPLTEKKMPSVLLQPQEKEESKTIPEKATLPLVLSLVPAYQGLVAELSDTTLFDNRWLVQNVEELENIAPNYLLPLEMREAVLYFSLGLELEKRFIIPQLSPTTQVVELKSEGAWQSHFVIDRFYEITWQPEEASPLYSWLNIETLLLQIPLISESLKSFDGQSTVEIAQKEQNFIIQLEELFSQLTIFLAPMSGSTLLEEHPFLGNFVTQFGIDTTLFYGEQLWSFDLLENNTVIEFPIKSVFSARESMQLQNVGDNKDTWHFVSVDVFDDNVLENIENLARLVWGEWFYWQGDAYG